MKFTGTDAINRVSTLKTRIIMKKLNRKSFAQMLIYLKTMEKLNLMVELFENLTIECREKPDFQPLKDFVDKYIRHKVKYHSKTRSLSRRE